MQTVAILLSTYNGQRFLDRQLESIYKQKHLENFDIQIVVRDDGSQDDTLNILKKWSVRMNITIYDKKNIGARESFYWLIINAPKADYYALCDQDDIWKEDKLSIAIKSIKEERMLYFSNMEYIDSNGRKLGKRFLKEDFKLSLKRVFMCNPANGCTMVWNSELQKILKIIPYDTFSMHDEFISTIALTMGKVIYDSEVSMYYRVHNFNVTQSSNLYKKMRLWKEVWFDRKLYSIDKRASMLLHYDVKKEAIPVLVELSNYKKGINRLQIAMKYNCEVMSISRSFKMRVIFGLA